MADYLIERFSTANHAAVRGHEPFVATGPNFYSHVIPGSLQSVGEYRIRSGLLSPLASLMGGYGGDWRDVAAEWLLREGIVQTFWCVDGGECLPPEMWWISSIEAVSRELPSDVDVPQAVVDLLSGLSDPQHFRTYVAEAGLSLEPCPVP